MPSSLAVEHGNVATNRNHHCKLNSWLEVIVRVSDKTNTLIGSLAVNLIIHQNLRVEDQGVPECVLEVRVLSIQLIHTEFMIGRRTGVDQDGQILHLGFGGG